MTMLEHDPDKQGNSLFAEVEDKRMRLQNQLINLRVSHDMLKKRNEVYYQQIAKMKVGKISHADAPPRDANPPEKLFNILLFFLTKERF